MYKAERKPFVFGRSLIQPRWPPRTRSPSANLTPPLNHHMLDFPLSPVCKTLSLALFSQFNHNLSTQPALCIPVCVFPRTPRARHLVLAFRPSFALSPPFHARSTFGGWGGFPPLCRASCECVPTLTESRKAFSSLIRTPSIRNANTCDCVTRQSPAASAGVCGEQQQQQHHHRPPPPLTPPPPPPPADSTLAHPLPPTLPPF